MNKFPWITEKILDDPDFFLSAVNFTAHRTAFAARLIEKDYFCSVVLEYLSSAGKGIVFKGGTCLAKVHAGFYRLSEDLDFVIPTPINSRRSERSKRTHALKQILAETPDRLSFLRLVHPLTGTNNSTQYISVISYKSLISGQLENIKIEIGLREPLLTAVRMYPSNTILLDPVSDQPLLKPVSLRCISKFEAFAEKFRAALTRRDVAIRDFFDIDYASQKLEIPVEDRKFIKLVKQKLSVPGNFPVDTSQTRLDILRQQLDTQLKPVLREKDFLEFDLERSIRTVLKMAGKVVGK
ncbi:MAG: nucleotidyl transferase AbiEii/AbiGii toxin family protein [Acidobacteria bacterium]|nr:nucleotidyl transferase AbiEii/AbiGii toxin family protein [Acidobacteriota bacterium]